MAAAMAGGKGRKKVSFCAKKRDLVHVLQRVPRVAAYATREKRERERERASEGGGSSTLVPCPAFASGSNGLQCFKHRPAAYVWGWITFELATRTPCPYEVGRACLHIGSLL